MLSGYCRQLLRRPVSVKLLLSVHIINYTEIFVVSFFVVTSHFIWSQGCFVLSIFLICAIIFGFLLRLLDELLHIRRVLDFRIPKHCIEPRIKFHIPNRTINQWAENNQCRFGQKKFKIQMYWQPNFWKAQRIGNISVRVAQLLR